MRPSPDKHPSLSVIICTYNRSASLTKTLASLIEQKNISREHYEVLVIDNNSNDSTEQVVQEFSAAYPGAIIYHFEATQGKTYALNKGIRNARGDILAFTDDDVVVSPEWLAAVRRASMQYPRCNAFGGRVIPLWPAVVPSWIVREGPYKNTGGALVDHDKGDTVRSYSDYGMYSPCGANMFFRKEVFSKYGTFNVGLNTRLNTMPMSEDTEFCSRLLRNSEEILYIPDAIAYHEVAPERLHKEYFRRHAMKSGRAFALIETGSSTGRILNAPKYLYRIVAHNVASYARSLLTLNCKRIFFHELKLLFYLAGLYEHISQGRRTHER